MAQDDWLCNILNLLFQVYNYSFHAFFCLDLLFKEWQVVTHLKLWAQERSCILNRFADLIEKHNDEIAALESWDSGKPYEQSYRSEIPTVARLMRYYAGTHISVN